MHGVTVGKGTLTPIWASLDFDFTTADVDPKILARATPGFSGADLQNMIKWVYTLQPSRSVSSF
jgi:hypothetical protein